MGISHDYNIAYANILLSRCLNPTDRLLNTDFFQKFIQNASFPVKFILLSDKSENSDILRAKQICHLN